MSNDTQADLLTLTTEIVATHVMHNSISANDVSTLIKAVHAALAGLGTAPEPVEAVQAPAVTVRTSVKPEHITCLEDGKKMKMLKRHLATDHGMTPAEYRAKWKLPADYPMVAPNYAATRRALAVSIGLGRKKGDTIAKPAVAAKPPRKSLKLKLDNV